MLPCAQCGRTPKRITTTVEAPADPSGLEQPDPNWDLSTIDGQIVRKHTVVYPATVDTPARKLLYAVHVWDGRSYQPHAFTRFCRLTCLSDYAHAALKNAEGSRKVKTPNSDNLS